jgi:molybdenum cofactor cytidylyltransferase
MGSAKALLRDDRGQTFVSRVALSLIAGGVERVVVVSGHEHEAIVSALAAEVPGAPPTVIRNPDPDRGQISSLWTGMDEVCRPDTDAIVVTLVDVPLVQAATVRIVVEAWRRTHAPIVRPAVGGRRGHPVVFDRSTFDELRRAPLDQGARVVVRAHAHDMLDVPVDDPGCIADVDTPADYRAILEGMDRSR